MNTRAVASPIRCMTPSTRARPGRVTGARPARSRHAHALAVDLDDVAAVQLAPAARLDLAVDAHDALRHELARLAAGLGQAGRA